MKKYKDIFGNEIKDPWYLNILQRLDQLKKRNKGRKNFSEEDKKELDGIVQELSKHGETLKEEIDKIPTSEQAKRIQSNLESKSGLFDTSIFDKKRLFDTSIFDKSIFDTSKFHKRILYRNGINRKARSNERD